MQPEQRFQGSFASDITRGEISDENESIYEKGDSLSRKIDHTNRPQDMELRGMGSATSFICLDFWKGGNNIFIKAMDNLSGLASGGVSL